MHKTCRAERIIPATQEPLIHGPATGMGVVADDEREREERELKGVRGKRESQKEKKEYGGKGERGRKSPKSPSLFLFLSGRQNPLCYRYWD